MVGGLQAYIHTYIQRHTHIQTVSYLLRAYIYIYIYAYQYQILKLTFEGHTLRRHRRNWQKVINIAIISAVLSICYVGNEIRLNVAAT